jgi:CelD/BcsL family acetyltransferase involved in cellulose biosynthesis
MRTVDNFDIALSSDAAPARAAPERPRVAIHALGRATAELCIGWDMLVQQAAEPNAFAERWFVGASAEHLPGAAEVRLASVHSDGRLIGLFPLSVKRLDSRLPVKHVSNYAHHNSFLGTPLIAEGQEAAAWGALIDMLDGARWAPGFLHWKELGDGGPVHRGLIEAAAARGRPCDTVYAAERAMLASLLGPAEYYETTVRKKKRKELKRLQSRLAEQGDIVARRLSDPAELPQWIDAFLALERSGWKGDAGSALACDAATEGFFRAALTGACEAGRLELLRLDCGERPIAMLVNFMTPPGAFSFKIAFDEEFARYSPGVLIQLDNYAVLDRPDIAWMDSCAAQDHPMINSLWAERRRVVRVTVPLAGAWRRSQFAVVRSAERLSAAIRRRRAGPMPEESLS